MENRNEARENVGKEDTFTERSTASAANASEDTDVVTLLDLRDILWSQKWFVIVITTIFSITSVCIALLLTPKYRSDVVLSPVTQDGAPNLLDQVSGLASLAGLSLGNPSQTRDSVAILRSRAFVMSFIQDHDLMKVLYEEAWDAANDRWVESEADDRPQLVDAVEDFQKYIFSVQEDATTGLVTIGIEWSDPIKAAEWVNELAHRINEDARGRAISEAERNLEYLHGQLEEANIVELRSAIARLIENEIKTLMLARARGEYAFKVIDPGVVPTQKASPRRALIVVTSTALGGFLAVLAALFRHSIKIRAQSRTRSA